MKESNDPGVSAELEAPAPALPRRNVLRRLYLWTIHWADTPYGPWALFLLALVEASVFPIPPDVLLLALCLGLPRRSLRYAGICTAGSVLGGCLGYVIGMFFMEAIGRPIIDFYNAQQVFDSIAQGFQAHGFLWIFAAALTPIPYKVFTIAAGACGIDFVVLVAASVLGRGLRFYAQGLLMKRFGTSISGLIDRWFNALTIGFLVLLVLGFVVVKMLWPGYGDRSPAPDRAPRQEGVHGEPPGP